MMTHSSVTVQLNIRYKRKDMEGYSVANLVEALSHKTEGRGFDSQWGHWIFLIYLIFSAALWPGILLELKGGRYWRLTSPPTVSRLTRLCGRFDVSQSHGPSWSLHCFTLCLFFEHKFSHFYIVLHCLYIFNINFTQVSLLNYSI
jgi:hypothetical protein